MTTIAPIGTMNDLNRINELIYISFALIVVDIDPSTRNPIRRHILLSNLDQVPEQIGWEENEEFDVDVRIVDFLKKETWK